ncbi:GNAT family N-acetyltransferase [Lysobacter pythonis]|uniref:L-ornithine N(alpha)-acyltransferase n=1 Tax=Solilutibacter pythonis TaxID=2483112 RepID=A0A3M2HTC7_9GAMM|nr:lysophospholipid acyltransferase family protein [Lysobacter pythonis]RMH91073.1 GNAT family N-acetyltransferase [Lysobacter pythonis]
MIQLEERLQQRFPHWFRGRRAPVARTLVRGVGRWSRLDRVESFLRANGHLRDFEFVRAALDHLEARYDIDEAALARVPVSGRLLIVANHPSGALDALALLDAVGRVRRDVRIVANDFLTTLTGLSNLLLPVRVFGGRAGADSVRAIESALAREECVIVFPAGEVSRLSSRGVRDGRWRPGFVRFARSAMAPVLPIHVQARNSALFYGASAIFKPAGTALLAREVFARQRRRIVLRVGRAACLPADVEPHEVLRRTRAALYRLGRGATPVASRPEALAMALPPERVRAGIAAMELLGRTSDGKEIRVGRLAASAPLLDEIGRLRELTFRQVGEGTGKRLDLDEYDAWYEHIVLWDANAMRIAGAYRVARGARILAEKGLPGLYTASLFHYDEAAVPRIAAGMELGRSFVVPEYWNSRSLDYLWQGIGAYLRVHPGVRYLFGPVSISAALPPAARDALVAYYSRYFGGGDGLAHSLRPFAYFAAPPDFGGLDADTAFRVLKHNLDALGSSVPTLYKQYTELCEPGGARFLAFGVDPDFNNAIDGLIELDLAAMRPKKRRRYIGERGAAA